MSKKERMKNEEARNWVLLYLALLKRGELVPIYNEAQKRAWRARRPANLKIN
ncbi:MAG TPA: hypothetical protein VLN41_01595 [Candidatus Bathyarchaeia archaeon]|nr:hypothetical protein [Candidatus Bathyarchaeia archaeon]